MGALEYYLKSDSLQILNRKNSYSKNSGAPAGVAQLFEHRPVILGTERSLVQFMVGAHASVAGSVPGQGTYRRQMINVSLPFFPPSFPLSKKKSK